MENNMKTLDIIQKTREYLDYLEEHIVNVEKAWKEMQVKCKDMRFIYDDFYHHWIDMQVQLHDVSKLSEYEFVQYRDAFFPLSYEEKEPLGSAWEHHKRHNPHHWENWTSLKIVSNPNEWEVHCVHMVIDWMAMGYKFGDTAQKFYEKNKEKIDLPDYAIDFIYEIFKRITFVNQE